MPCVLGMTWQQNKLTSAATPSKYTYLQNLALTPYINSDRSVLLTFELVFTVLSDTIGSRVGLRLDVYRTSSLGLITSKLASYPGIQTASVKLCLPTGRLQLAFLGYSDFCRVYLQIGLSKLRLTETECAPPTQTSYCEHLITRQKIC